MEEIVYNSEGIPQIIISGGGEEGPDSYGGGWEPNGGLTFAEPQYDYGNTYGGTQSYDTPYNYQSYDYQPYDQSYDYQPEYNGGLTFADQTSTGEGLPPGYTMDETGWVSYTGDQTGGQGQSPYGSAETDQYGEPVIYYDANGNEVDSNGNAINWGSYGYDQGGNAIDQTYSYDQYGNYSPNAGYNQYGQPSPYGYGNSYNPQTGQPYATGGQPWGGNQPGTAGQPYGGTGTQPRPGGQPTGGQPTGGQPTGGGGYPQGGGQGGGGQQGGGSSIWDSIWPLLLAGGAGYLLSSLLGNKSSGSFTPGSIGATPAQASAITPRTLVNPGVNPGLSVGPAWGNPNATPTPGFVAPSASTLGKLVVPGQVQLPKPTV